MAIEWMDWGEEAFRKAREEGKLVLLFIEMPWSRWCKFMESTTYSDPDVQEIVNREYIPVKVNGERRSDIDDRYNQGGWPTNALLFHSGEILTGTTYLDPDEMKELLVQVADYCKENRVEVASRVIEFWQEVQRRREGMRIPTVRKEVDWEGIINDVISSIISEYDPLNGWIRDDVKIPMPWMIQLAMWEARDEDIAAIALHTMERMAEGGLYDKEEGGFFRYSTSQDWGSPSCEKLLSTNAELLEVYTNSYLLWGMDSHKDVAEGIIRYLNTFLWDEELGAFYGSQEDDRDFYKLKGPERRMARRPEVDKTIYVSANAIAARSYLRASVPFDIPTCVEQAMDVLEFLITECYEPGIGMAHYYDGIPHYLGLLDDQATTILALLEALDMFGEKEGIVEIAKGIGDFILEKLYDPVTGGFFDIPESPDAIGLLKIPEKDLVSSSLASIALLKLGWATEDERYVNASRRSLEFLSDKVEPYGSHASIYAVAAKMLLRGPTRIAIVGDPTDEGFVRMFLVSTYLFEPTKVVRIFELSEGEETMWGGMKLVGHSSPASYISTSGGQAGPLFEVEELVNAVDELIGL
jgi:uncharacterized protein YyaL (SSP411 family)